MATVDCGRLNEGGEGTVTGVVTGNTAVLVVTSGRNGAIMLGTARQLGSKPAALAGARRSQAR